MSVTKKIAHKAEAVSGGAKKKVCRIDGHARAVGQRIFGRSSSTWQA